MLILNTEQTRAADAYTIAQEPIASVDLMERASQRFCKWFREQFSSNTIGQVHVFCGKGNNGGDGLVVARILAGRGYQVNVYLLDKEKTGSNDSLINLQYLALMPSVSVFNALDSVFNDVVYQEDIIIDALLGSGLNKALEGPIAELVEQLNALDATRVSIDIPTGLFADTATTGITFKAHYTFSFERPKLAFFMAENATSVGEWSVGGIGLSKDFLSQQNGAYHYLTTDELYLKPRPKHGHKGTFGHSLLMAGSYGKFGAAVLSAKACLRSGTGLLSVAIPDKGIPVMQTAFPEAMCIAYNADKHLAVQAIDLDKFDVIAIGPGIGVHIDTVKLLEHTMLKYAKPMVLDADALNIVAAYDHLKNMIPKGSILTPHPKEFERLFGATDNSFDRLELLRAKAQEMEVVIVLKGANTAVALPNGEVWFNTTGTPAMATAGSGDVLTGIISGLLAQGYSSEDAARYGVFVHGLAGELSELENGQAGTLSGDIADHIGAALELLR